MQSNLTPQTGNAPSAGALRVLLVCEDIPGAALGGLARHVVSLGNALIDAGHSVTLMGRALVPGAPPAEPSGFRGPFITGFPDPFRAWKERATGMFNPWKRPYFARRIARAIVARADQFDVVHYHGHLPMVGRYVPEGVPFLQTRHDQGSECITHLRFRDGAVCTSMDPRVCARCIHHAPGPLRTAVSAATVRRYRREAAEAFVRHPVVFVSKFLLDNYQRAVPVSGSLRAHVLHNFVDEASLQAAAKSARASHARRNDQVLVHVAGRLEATKGIAELVKLLLPRMPAHWRIQVFGDGPDRAGLAALDDARLDLRGHQPLANVVLAAAAADVTVVPSVWEEAFGLVTLEALRLGKPCHALRRGGTPELACYGSSGQLRLYEDLPAMVTGLLADGAIDPPEGSGDSADVGARLPELLAIYRATRIALSR